MRRQQCATDLLVNILFVCFSRSNKFFKKLRWGEDIFKLDDDNIIPSVADHYHVYQLNELTLFSPLPISVPNKFLKNHKETQLIR